MGIYAQPPLLFNSSLTDGWSNSLSAMAWNPIRAWLDSHPLYNWLFTHPLWLLGLVAGGLLLFAGLWSAIARLTEGFWLGLVKLPFQAIAWLFMGLVWLLTRRQAQSPSTPPPADRVTEIVGRLESLQAEQEILLQEMRQILAEKEAK